MPTAGRLESATEAVADLAIGVPWLFMNSPG